jgi:hypothetical protein
MKTRKKSASVSDAISDGSDRFALKLEGRRKKELKGI